MQYEIDIVVNLTVRFYGCPQTLYDRKVRVFAHRNRFERSKIHWKHDRVADIRYKKIKKVMYEERKINSIWVMDYRLCRRNRNSWCVYSTLLKCTRSFFFEERGVRSYPALSLYSLAITESVLIRSVNPFEWTKLQRSTMNIVTVSEWRTKSIYITVIRGDSKIAIYACR